MQQVTEFFAQFGSGAVLFELALPAMFAGLVAIFSTIAVERLGGMVGGVLSSIPTTIVPAAIGLWGDGGDPDGFRRAMAFVPVGILLNAGYLVLWRIIPAALGQRTRAHLLAWTVLLALSAWVLAAVAVIVLNELAQPTVSQSLIFGGMAMAAGLTLALAANRHAHPAPRGTQRVGWKVLVIRGIAAAIVIAIAIAIKRSGLPVASGMAAVFPVIFTTILVATWLSQGAHVPTGAVGPMTLGTLSVSAYALLATVLFPRIGVFPAAVLCWIAAVSFVSVPSYVYLKRHALRRDRAAQGRCTGS